MAIMILAERGKLSYDDHLTDLFPDFPQYGKTITIRNLLNHTSGLIEYGERDLDLHALRSALAGAE